MTTQHTLTDVATLRDQARKHMGRGAVTAGYSADRSRVLKMLNEALATEIVCVCVCCATGATISWRAVSMAKAQVPSF